MHVRRATSCRLFPALRPRQPLAPRRAQRSGGAAEQVKAAAASVPRAVPVAAPRGASPSTVRVESGKRSRRQLQQRGAPLTETQKNKKKIEKKNKRRRRRRMSPWRCSTSPSTSPKRRPWQVDTRDLVAGAGLEQPLLRRLRVASDSRERGKACGRRHGGKGRRCPSRL